MSTPYGVFLYNFIILSLLDGDILKNASCYERIRALREDNDKKQSEVAAALFMKPTQYGRYERGERELPLNVAVAIAKYYNVSLDYIAGLSDEKEPFSPAELTAQEKSFIKELRKLNGFEKGQIYERISVLAEKRIKADK